MSNRFRKVSPARARKLRRLGEHVYFSAHHWALVWEFQYSERTRLQGRRAKERQRELLRHALGGSVQEGDLKPRRNHYVTGPGSSDYPDCIALVAAGLMTRHDGSALSGGDPIFVVTAAGKEVANG